MVVIIDERGKKRFVKKEENNDLFGKFSIRNKKYVLCVDGGNKKLTIATVLRKI